MNRNIKVAVLGSTGYVGIELVNILINHPNIQINFLGCEKDFNKEIFNSKNISLPKLSLNNQFDPNNSDFVFLALPHGVSQIYVQKFFNKIKIIDLSADFRLDSNYLYKFNYKINHICPNLLKDFIYGLPEINEKNIIKNNNIAIPGCYPTSVLLPIIPILKANLIDTKNIIIDSKSGYSGAGKRFDLSKIKNSFDLNFYNYNTNNHRHICEIQQELNRYSSNSINFSFNPHILPSFRGMMSTIYCDLSKGVKVATIKQTLKDFYNNKDFVKIVDNQYQADFFAVYKTNNCIIKIFNHQSEDKIIIVSLIDNLIKGAAGQAVQCFNLMSNFDENVSLINIK